MGRVDQGRGSSLKNSTCRNHGRNLDKSKNHASPRSRARMHARARARGHHAWLARSTSRPCMHGAYAAVRRGACMLLVLTLRVNQQQDQRGRHRRSSLLRATHPPHPTYWLGPTRHYASTIFQKASSPARERAKGILY